MNLMDLDEAQGLTPQMVREWLLANQWEPRGSSAAHLYYQCGSGEISEALLHEDLGWVVDLLAQSYERSVQSILREINPRMRKGVPSEAAREAHPGGLWLATPDFACIGAHVPVVVTFDGDGFGVWHPEGFALPDSKPKTAALWHFWPCDANGNKVRWPTDAEGNML